MERRELISCLWRLNKHFGRKVKFKTGYPRSEAEGPACYPPTATLMFPPYNAFYDKRVLAHEYAHIIDADHRVTTLVSTHDKEFESIYREVCLAAGARYTPTKRLIKIIAASYNKEKRAARDSGGQTKFEQDVTILLKQIADRGSWRARKRRASGTV